MLGVAEAGFFPGIILYLTFWYPAKYRARVMSAFILGAPLSAVLGGPICGYLLELNAVGGLRAGNGFSYAREFQRYCSGYLRSFTSPINLRRRSGSSLRSGRGLKSGLHPKPSLESEPIG